MFSNARATKAANPQLERRKSSESQTTETDFFPETELLGGRAKGRRGNGGTGLPKGVGAEARRPRRSHGTPVTNSY